MLYFTTATSVTEKAKQVLDGGRLPLPGAVVVWDETVGRRKGARAVPKGWWAGHGSLTVAFVFPERRGAAQQDRLERAAEAVARAVASFHPRAEVEFRSPNDLMLQGGRLGAVFAERYGGAEIVVVRLNIANDLTKAPNEVQATAARLMDFVDARRLPLQSPSTLPNALLGRLLDEMPRAVYEAS